MELSTQNAFQVIFPKYVELLTQSPLFVDQGLQTFIRDELPHKIELVRSIQPTFLGFQTQFTNLILKRPKQQNLVQSLVLKASQKMEKLFYNLELSTDKQINKNSLTNEMSFLNMQQIRTRFRQQLKQMGSLLKQKYFQCHQIDKNVQQNIARRLYCLSEIYYFLKNDLNSVASRFKIKEHQILNEINRNGSSGNTSLQISGLIYLDQKLIENIREIVDKRYRPFLGKKDFFYSKVKQMQNQSESKVPMNINVLIQSILSKQKYRINKQVGASLSRQLKTIDQTIQQQVQRDCKQIISDVDSLKKQFNQLKNNVFYLDIIRGTFNQKYKMELNKLENVYYLSNIEKYLQDVQTFTQKLIRVQQKIIENRKSFMKRFGKQIQQKIAGLTAQYELKNSNYSSTIQNLIESQFDSLKNCLYGLISDDEPKKQIKSSSEDIKRQKVNELQQRRYEMQRQKQQKQIQRKRDLQQKAQKQRIKRQQDRIKLQERRRTEDERIRRMKQERQQAQRVRKFEQMQKQKLRSVQMQEKRKLMKIKEQEEKQRVKQQMKRKQQEKRRKQVQDAKTRDKLRAEKQIEQKRKLQELDYKKKQIQEAKRKKQQQQRLQQQKARDEKQRIQKQKRQQQQNEQKQKQLKIRQQKQERQKRERQLRSQRQKQQQERRDYLQKERKQRENKLERQKQQRQLKQQQQRQKRQKQKMSQLQRQKKQTQERQKLRMAQIEKQKKQREQKQRRQKQQREKRQKQERQRAQNRQKQERQRRQKEERQIRQKQQKQRKQREQKVLRQKQQRERRQKQQRQRRQREDNQRRQRQQRQRRQKKQKQSRQQRQRQQRQRIQRQVKQKKRQQQAMRVIKQKQQKKKQQQKKKRLQNEQRQRKQLQLLMQQQQNIKKNKSKVSNDRKSKGGSGINYDDLDDIMDDDIEQMDQQKQSKVSKSKNQKDQYADDYQDDFQSPQKDQQQQPSGPMIQPKQLITLQSIKCLNDYMKGTSYSRKNKPNLQPFNNKQSYAYLFEQFSQSRKIFIFDSAVSKAILQFSLQLLDENANEQDLKMSLQTIKQQMFSDYASKIQQQTFDPKTKLILPFSFENQYDIKVIQFLPQHGWFKSVIGKQIQDQQTQSRFNSIIEGLLHIFQIQTQPHIQSVLIPQQSRLVLETFDKQLPCLLTMFAMHYQIQTKQQFEITQYTVQRFFYTIQILKPFYEAIQNNQQQLSNFYQQTAQKYSQNQPIRIIPLQIQSSQPNYQGKLQQYALQAKKMFIDDKKINTLLLLFQVLIVPQEEQQESGASFQKISIYCSIQRTSPKATISYFIVSKDDFDKQNGSTLFDIISEGDDEFEVNVFMDYARHNGLSQYSDWTLPLWARSIQKRKLQPVNAFRAITFSMSPYYIAYKQQD